MKKKVLGILSCIFVLFVCLTLSACKGRYDNMKFKVLYAFSEDAETWYDGTNGIDAYYGTEDDMLPQQNDGWAKIFIKIDVLNVKSKYVDNIFVSSSSSTGIDFKSVTVKENKVFSIGVKDKTSFELSMLETLSKKSKKVQVNASYPLERIETNYDANPTVVMGSTIDLNKFSNLIFYPFNKTNQTQVRYEINKVGYFVKTAGENNEFIGTTSKAGVSINNGILAVDNNFNFGSERYAIEIVATSIYDASKTSTFYVYVVTNDNNIPTVKYYNNNGENNAEITSNVTLYSGSQFATATLVVGYENVADIFKNGKYVTYNSVAKLVPQIYVGGSDVPVEVDKQSQKEDALFGLHFNAGMADNVFSITATTPNNAAGVDVDFKLEFNVLNFGNANIGSNSKKIVVQKGQLATGIKINNEEVEINGNREEKIYATQGKTNAKSLTISAINSSNAYEKIYIQKDNNLTVSPYADSSKTFIYTNKQINVNFANNDTSGTGNMNLWVRSNPEQFQGLDLNEERITVSLTFKKVITADGFAVYKDKNYQSQIANRELRVGVGITNNLYLRVYYSNGEFDNVSAESVVIQSASKDVQFENNQENLTELELNKVSMGNKGQENVNPEFLGQNYVEYKISFASINANAKSTAITLYSGSKTLKNIMFSFNAVPTLISNGEFDLAPSINTTDAVRMQNDFEINNNHLNYAIVFNKTVYFDVVGKINNIEKTSAVVSGIDILNFNNADFGNENFSNDAVDISKLSNFNFQIRSVRANKTRVAKIAVSYYAFDSENDCVVLKTGNEAKVLTAEFAVYVPIDHFEISPTLSTLTHINNNITQSGNYAEYTQVDIEYRALSEYLSSSPSQAIYFTTGSDTELNFVQKNPNQINLTFNPSIDHSSLEILRYENENSNPISITENSITFANLNGKIKVSLKNESVINNLRLTFVPSIFGQIKQDVQQSSVINFQTCAVAKTVEISGQDIQNRVENSNYISVSFIDTEMNKSVVKKFNAVAVYDELDSNKLQLGLLDYEIRKVEDGVVSSATETNIGVEIKFENGLATLSATNNGINGGLYQISIFAPDSYNEQNEDNPYSAINYVYLEISNGDEKSPYALYNEQDFAKIRNNNSSERITYYVLGADFTVDLASLYSDEDAEKYYEFFGNLSGEYSVYDNDKNLYTFRYTLTVVLNDAVSFGLNNYVGLFSKINSRAKISNLNLDVVFDLDQISTTSGDVYIGGLAGINEGEINNVDVNLKYNNNINLNVFNSSNLNTVWFGGLVGVNDVNGRIIMENSSVVSNGIVVLPMNNENTNLVNNIGLIAGENKYIIEGNYLGKSSLNNVAYSIVADLTIKDIKTTIKVAKTNVGAVAGLASGASLISNIIVGGKIELEDFSNSSQNYLGGIVGNASNENGIGQKGIYNCATLGLDLTNKIARGYVGGIAGKTNNVTINDVRVMATYARFSGFSTLGKISGTNVVAGVVADLNGGSIANASVESFVDSINNDIFYMFESANNSVYGLACQNSSATLTSCFVSANIKNVSSENAIYLTTNGTESYTYYLGRINDIENNFENADFVRANENCSYAVVYDNENIYYYNHETGLIKCSEENLSGWDNFVKTNLTNLTWTENSATNFALQDSKNLIKIGETNYYFPYLVSSTGEAQMVERPSLITAKFNDDYAIYTNSHIITVGEMIITSEQIKNNIVDIIFVNYFEFEDKNKNDEIYNTHNLINTDEENANGLIDLGVFPDNTQGGVKFEVVNILGYNYARIINSSSGDKIVFSGVSGNLPIIVRAYSIFNPEAQCFVVFFTQNGISKLNITSTSTTINVSGKDADFELVTYTNSAPIILNFKADNIFEGQRFKTLFDNLEDYSNFISIEAESKDIGFDSSVLQIAKSSSKTALQLTVVKDFENYYYEGIITFSLYLNLNDYIAGNGYTFNLLEGKSEKLLVAQVSLKVMVFKSTEKISIDIEAKEFDSETPISLDVTLQTSFVETDEDGTLQAGGSKRVGDFVRNGNSINLNETGKDSLILTFKAKNADDKALQNLLDASGETFIAGLFDITNITYKFYYENQADERVLKGYVYTIEFVLKEGYNYRHIVENIDLILTINSTTNPNPSADKLGDLAPEIELTIMPTEFKSARIYNYAATDMQAENVSQKIVTSNSLDSNYISPSPNSYGSILAIHLQPNYAIIKDATISSSSATVPSLSKPVYLVLSQVVPVETGVFKTVIAGSTDGSLKLNTSPDYVDENGIIYVHAMVSESFAGYAALLKLTLTANVGDATHGTDKTITVEKELLTTYLPGVYLSYNQSAAVSGENDAYFMQEDSYNNQVGITLYGYELKSKPSISFVWNVDENSKYDYLRDENGEVLDYGTLVEKANETKTYKVSEFIRHRDINSFENLQANPDGSVTFNFNIDLFKFSQEQKEGETPKEIPASFKLNVALEFSDGSKDEKSLTFYPVEYLLTGVTLERMVNNNFYANISASTMLKFKFITTNPNLNEDGQAKIYEDILTSLNNPDSGDEFNAVKTLAHAFSFTGSTSGYFDDANLSAFKVTYIKKEGLSGSENAMFYICIEGLAETQFNVSFRLNYAFVKDEFGMYHIRFGTENQFTGTNSLTFNFNLVISVETSQDAPIPLFKGDFVSKINQYSGADFILMDDVDLYDFTPITTNIASLDGNNKVIRIHSFSVAADRTEYGLFAHIGTFQSGTQNKNTILKNVIVDYSQFEGLRLARNNATNFVFGGLVATVNAGGLVYNCDVMNVYSGQNQTKTVDIIVDDVQGTTIVFGGLVGVNNGIITNSRVGRLGYKKISYTITTNENNDVTYTESDGDTYPAKPLSFVLGANLGEGANSFVGIAGGFVGRNDGTIASSYVANTSLYSYSAVADESNKTAGFVAENNGTIKLSYVKGNEDSITSGDASTAKMRATGSKIVGAANAIVAGFVYTNSNIIENCFANIELETKSSFLSGFVYENLDGASIDMCYSACTLNSNAEENSLHEQPFVGVDAGNNLLSLGSIKNCYYLEETGSVYTLPDNYEGLDQAIGLDGNNFSNYETLNNFVFIRSENNEIRNQGIWTHTTLDTNQVHILPELTSANIVAHSYRILISQNDNVYTYAYAPSYTLGSVNNPYIISNANEFNIVLTGKQDNSANKRQGQVGYIRMINNIDFENIAILTRSNFSLGDKMNYSITSFEGNGMTISNIYLDVLNLLQTEGLQSNSLEKVGLFAEMNNTYFKNVDLEFASLEYAEQNPTIPIKYSGGLAGVINNSAIINVNLIGNNTTIAGSNFVGGVAGLISGNSFIYGVTTNLGAISGSYPNDNLYYNEEDFNTMRNLNIVSNEYRTYESYLNTLSYAGGVAGVLDLQKREYLDYNISNVDVLGNNMATRTEGNIVGNIAGGAAGFANENTNAYKLRFYIGNSTIIKGVSAVGGLYGIGVGRYDNSGNAIPSLVACQVTEIEDTRYNIDTNYGNYIIDLEKNGSATLGDNVGNKTLLISEGYAGGLVGVSIAQSFESNYAKTSLNWANTFGGAVGLSIGATLTHVYAVPYVNLSNKVVTNVGGLIGVGYKISNTATQYNAYTSYAKYLLNINDKNTDIVYNFSTLLLDNNQLANILAGKVEDDGEIVKIVDDNGNFVKHIDYLVAQYASSSGECYVNSNSISITSGNLSVYVGQVNNYAKFEETKVINHSTKANAINLSELFDKDDTDQPVLFKNIFGDWPTKYWLLDFEKYFPLLLKENALNYIIIDEADDFYTMLENPDLNYKIVCDIDMQNWSGSGNWVFDVSNFTGTLIGEVGEGQGNLPKVYNLHKTTTINGESAGLFRKTTGATIKDIDWIWNDINDSNVDQNAYSSIDFGENVKNLTTIGGISCEDVASKFNNLNVYVGGYFKQINLDPNINFINNKYYEDNSRVITGFGGIVGNGENSQIENCSFNGNVKVYLENINGNTYFGGLAGNAIKSETSHSFGVGYQPRSIVMSSMVGNGTTGSNNNNLVVPSNFEIKLGDARLSYVGGAIGHAYSTSISTINVGSTTNQNAVIMNLEVQDKGNIYVGGLVGNESDSSVSDTNAITNITFTSFKTSTGGTLNVGGLIGLVEQSLSSTASGVRDSSVFTNIDLTKLNMTYINVAGGIAVVTTGGLVEINQCTFVGTINSELETGDDEISYYLNNIYSGGVVAKQTGSGNLSFKEVASAVDITIGTTNISKKAEGDAGGDTIIGTTTLFMGGFVGDAEGSVYVSNCLSNGKFIPITTSSNKDYTIYVGGFVGSANKVNFANSISTVSIIADSVNSASIKDLHIHALLGDVVSKDSSVACNNVIFSSDIALFPEDLCSTANNISAYSLTKHSGNVTWKNQLINSGYWINTNLIDNSGMTTDYGLPTLANGKIISKLREYGVLEGEGDSGVHYIEGKSSNPKEIFDLSQADLTSKYAFYIFNADRNTVLPVDSIALNGVLISGDTEYSVIYSQIGGDSTLESKGIFGEIMRHSAVSNLHVWVGNKDSKGDKNLNMTNAANFGVIAGFNNGVVFNCSVQGTGLFANTSGTNSAGLIVGRNAGLVSYCYSSAEIVKMEGNSLSGIVHTNVDKILSCYFTGYIDNATITADETHGVVGIVFTNIDGSLDLASEKGKTPYVYNNYMAGVIVNVNNNNAFVGDKNGLINNEGKAIGSRNFVDINVNGTKIEQTAKGQDSAGGNVNCLSTISTHTLMANTDLSNNILDGNWLTSGKTRLINGSEQYYIDTTSPSYGYNYLYPVYNFNKSSASNNILGNVDFVQLQLYTGTGGDAKILTENFVSKHDKGTDEIVSDKDQIINGNSDYYVNALKIPHLGVLKAIQGLSTTVAKVPNTENSYEIKFTDLNYVLIYDINGRFNSNASVEDNYKWTAVGSRQRSSEEKNGFIVNAAQQFNGLFVSNKYYDYNDYKTDTTENYCVIKNLSGQGLFDNINSAYFGYFILGDFTKLENSGALGVTVNSDDGKDVVVENLFYQDFTTYSSVEKSGNYISAMFGKLEAFADVKIINSGVKGNAESSGYITLADATYMGLIVGDFENGKISFKDCTSLRVNFAATALGQDYFAGGLIGILTNGSVAGGDIGENNGSQGAGSNAKRTAVLIVPQNNDNNAYLGAVKIGGIVGFAQKSNQGSETADINVISDIKVGFPTEYTAAGFGGLVYKNSDAIINFKNCELAATNNEVNLTLRDDTKGNFFGFVAAEMEAGLPTTKLGVYVENLVIDEIAVKIQLVNKLSVSNDDINEDRQGFGGLVGSFKGGCLSFSANKFKVTLQVRSANVGGVAGYFSKGSIGIYCPNGEDQFMVTLSGYYNVGGAFGYFTDASLNNIFIQNGSQEGGQGGSAQGWNVLNSDYPFAKIKSFDSASVQDLQGKMSFANWGGIFGYFNNDNFNGVEIVNKNNIYLDTIKVEGSMTDLTPTLKNVGGVAGKVKSKGESASISNLTNYGVIEEISNDNSDSSGTGSEGSTGGEEGNDNQDAKMYKKFSNEKDVFLVKFSAKSKQNSVFYYAISAVNVGGVIGFVDNATISQIKAAEGSVFGYQNVGALIGYAKDVEVLNGCTVSSKLQIVGVVNVGGAIGAVDSSGKTISGIKVEKGAKVYGNYNVGGLIGYIAKGVVDSCSVGASGSSADEGQVSGSAPNEVQVKGIYFSTISYISVGGMSGMEGPPMPGNNINKEAYFFPANVGGLVGSTFKPSSNTDVFVKLKNNQISNVFVTSSVEGEINDLLGDENSRPVVNESTVISTVSNAVLYNGNVNAEENLSLSKLISSENPSSGVESKINSAYLQDFNDVNTGFGGLVGATNGTVVMQNSTDEENKMSNVRIDASLGINVGSFYGYYYANLVSSGTEPKAIKTAYLTNDIFVSGAYFVGGIAGKVEVDGKGVAILQFDNQIGNGNISAETTNGAPTIYIQTGTYNMGMYVGGLFGCVKGNANGVFINGNDSNSVQFRMNNSNSYYSGGLIGRLEGNLGDGNAAIDANIVNAKNDETNKDSAAFALIAGNYENIIKDDTKDAATKPIDIKSAQATENFGGLVGMLKKTSDSTAYVIGWHPFAFTINTIENQNYADGETTYDYEDRIDQELYLTAQAYYVNRDNFEISTSRGGAQVGTNVKTEEISVYKYFDSLGLSFEDAYGAFYATNSIWYGLDCNNPINPNNSQGWAKEYTMFRNVQRNIPGGNGAGWDSIATIYDAGQITYVATTLNSYSITEDANNVLKNNGVTNFVEHEGWYNQLSIPLSIFGLAKNSLNNITYEYTDNGTTPVSLYDHYVNLNLSDEELIDSLANYIFYTIYETSKYTDGNSNCEPVLYSRMGIATAYKENGQFTTPISRLSVVQDANIANYDRISLGDRFADYTFIPNTNFSNTLTYMSNWNVEENNFVKFFEDGDNYIYKSYETKDNTNSPKITNVGETDKNTCYLDFLGKTNITITHEETDERIDTEHNNYAACLIPNTNYKRQDVTEQNNDIWFVFKTLFTNSQSENGKDSESQSQKGEYSDVNLPDNGSIFNVSGIVQEGSNYKNENFEFQPPWWQNMWSWGWFGHAGSSLGLAILGGILGGPWGAIIGGIVGLGSSLGLGSAICSALDHTRVLVKNWDSSNSIILDKTFKRVGKSYGLISETYSREILYEKDGENYILRASPETYISVDGLNYIYYSSIRPSNFYDEYYLLIDLSVPEGETELVAKDKVEIKIEDGETVYHYNDKDYKLDPDAGYKQIIMHNFELKNGVYYKNSLAQDLEYIPMQNTNSLNNENYNASYFYEDEESGYYYTLGKYDGTQYSLPEDDVKEINNNLYQTSIGGRIDNQLSKDKKFYYANEADFVEKTGVPFVKNVQTGFVPIPSEKLGLYDIGDEYINNKNSDLSKYKYYYGYGYMKNAYYTADGTAGISNTESKVGTFNYYGYLYNGKYYKDSAEIDAPTGQDGIDYISIDWSYIRDYYTPEGVYRPLIENFTTYYTFTSAENSDIKGSNYDYSFRNREDKDTSTTEPTFDINKFINDHESEIKASFKINLYPKSFVNPYLEERENVRDGLYYLNQNLPEQPTGTSLQTEVKYYYYEGGDYKIKATGQDVDSNMGLDANGTANIYNFYAELTENADGTFTYDKQKLELELEKITIFEPSQIPNMPSNPITVTLKDLAKDYGKYKDYYLTNTTFAKITDSNGNQVSSYGEEINKVKDQFIVDNSGNTYKIYIRNMQNFVFHNGIYCKRVTKFDEGDTDYNRNKYLMDKDLQFYTRYMFEDGKSLNASNDIDTNIWESGIWSYKEQKGQYYLYRDSNIPNKDTTYFVESALVTLGGKRTVYTGYATPTSGSFKAK